MDGEISNMARFTDEWLSQLLDKNDIVDVIEGYMPLNKRGANYWAKCPWHSETRPSFSVSSSKQIFYCFSCGRGGNAIKFIMEQEKLSYPEAVRKLADRVGMDMPEQEYDPNFKTRQEHKKRLSLLMVDAARYFHNNLKLPAGSPGLDYFKKRGIYSQINKFGLGYALKDFDDLTKYLKNKGYTLKEILDSGVAKQKDSKVYDTFRDRAIFPIMDAAGNVIAFGGRIIGQGDPKYLNSPETLLFNKRRNLYNLSRVKKERDLKAIILAEGYMDVVALASAGINTAVASLGTALSDEQARLIKRYVKKVYLSYDGDAPGIKAALRGVEILTKAGLLVYVIQLPEGMDPDELIKKYGVNKYYEYVKNAAPAFQFKLNMLKRNYNLDIPDELMQYAKAASKMISQLPEGIERDRYIKYLSKETGIYTDTLTREISKAAPEEKLDIPNMPETKTLADPEDKLISMIIQNPSVLAQTDIINEGVFGNELYKKIFNFANDRISRGIPANCADILSQFSEEGLEPALIAANEFPDNVSKIDLIRGFLQEIEIKTANNKREFILKQIENSNSEERVALLNELNELNKEIQSLKANYI